MSLTKKLKMAMIDMNINQVELAKRTEQAQSTLSKKMTTDNFNLKEYERLVNAIGCTLKIEIILPDGRSI